MRLNERMIMMGAGIKRNTHSLMNYLENRYQISKVNSKYNTYLNSKNVIMYFSVISFSTWIRYKSCSPSINESRKLYGGSSNANN